MTPQDKKIAVYATIAFVLFVAFCIGGAAGCKEYTRYQKRADANNAAKITHINIEKARQQARINRAQVEAIKAEADKRREEAKGIRDAQETINKTLTPLYVQHEAIRAQQAIATSGNNNTVIYVPAGTNGTPTITATGETGK